MRILAVDDEPDTRKLVKEILTQAGHIVTSASNGIEAMALLRMQKIDLVLLDLMMPGVGGLQLAQYLSTHWNTFETPVMVLSCRKDAQSKSWSKHTGCVRYMEKPFSPAELIDAVAEIGRTRGKSAEGGISEAS